MLVTHQSICVSKNFRTTTAFLDRFIRFRFVDILCFALVFQNESLEHVNPLALVARENVFHILLVVHPFEMFVKWQKSFKIQATVWTSVLIVVDMLVKNYVSTQVQLFC
jgi:hypothetical protein